MADGGSIREVSAEQLVRKVRPLGVSTSSVGQVAPTILQERRLSPRPCPVAAVWR